MKLRWLIPITILVVLIASIAIIIGLGSTTHKSLTVPITTKSSKLPSSNHLPKTPSNQLTSLDHIFIIVEENKPLNSIINNPSASYINYLAKRYALATNYYAVAHPSLPNYLALTSGSTDGISTDCNPPSAGCEVNVQNIADQIKASGRTWKEYAESMPSNCYAYNSGEYVTKHNPFIYYTDIINNPKRCQADVVPFSQLKTDLQSVSTTPNYAFITPNVCNDMHDCSVSIGDTWLQQNVPMILNSKAFTTQNSLLIITWDEGYATTNHVATLLIGSNVKQGLQLTGNYSHYSLLHTIENAWGLPPLTNSVTQSPVVKDFLN